MVSFKMKRIHMVIMCLLTLGISICPPIGQITPLGMKSLAVFVGVMYGWITIDLIFPSIFGFVALSLFNIMSAPVAFANGFGNAQVLQVLAAMVFTGGLDAVGVTNLIANWLLSQKIIRKNPWFLVMGIILIAYVLGLCGSAFASILLLWAVVMQIAEDCNCPKKDPIISFLLLMITIASFAGMFVMPFYPPSMTFTGFFSQASGMPFTGISFIAVSGLTTLSTLIIMCLVAKFIFRINPSNFSISDDLALNFQNNTVAMKEKIGLVILIVYIIVLILPSIFPQIPGASIINSLGVCGVSLLGMLILTACSVKGNSIVDLSQMWTRYTEWPLILLLAVTFPLASALQANEAGIMTTIMSILVPLTSSLSPTALLIFAMIVLGILTQFTHNIVLAAVFSPILIPLYVSMGGNPYTISFAMYFVLNASYVTPAASLQSAMVHGNTAMDNKLAYLLGTVFLIVTWIVVLLITVPLTNIIYS